MSKLMIRGLLPVIVIGIAVQGCDLAAETEGMLLYEQHCANCHMSDGQGLNALIPPLDQSDYLQNGDISMACIIRYGLSEGVEVNGVKYGGQAMPGKPELTDVQITNIINYVRRSWSNNLPPKTLYEVQTNLTKCAGD